MLLLYRYAYCHKDQLDSENPFIWFRASLMNETKWILWSWLTDSYRYEFCCYSNGCGDRIITPCHVSTASLFFSFIVNCLRLFLGISNVRIAIMILDISGHEKLHKKNQVTSIQQKTSVGIFQSNLTLWVRFEIIKTNQRCCNSHEHLRHCNVIFGLILEYEWDG